MDGSMDGSIEFLLHSMQASRAKSLLGLEFVSLEESAMVFVA